MTPATERVAVLSGGVGAARFLRGLRQVVEPSHISAVVNVADDIVLHGLHVSPDLDTITYTLADEINPETGWGLRDETWQALEMVRRYGGVSWFNLGDRDLGTHLYRTHRLGQGATLTEVTAEITATHGVGIEVLPVTDQRVETRVTVPELGEIGFQEYFVRHRHDVPVTSVRFAGIDDCRPTDRVRQVLDEADVVVIAPSNPIVSVGPVLAVPGLADLLADRRDRVVAVSPIIAGRALKGPADRLLAELGHEASVVGVARIYASVARALVIDEADADSADAVGAAGLEPVVCPTIMTDDLVAAGLARHTLGAVRR